MNDPLIQIENLKIFFVNRNIFIRAVDGISLIIRKGERFGLVGESGSGKSMTAAGIMGLISGLPGIIEGRIFFQNLNLLKNLERYCRIEKKEGRLVIKKKINTWQKIHDKTMKGVRGKKIAMVFPHATASLAPYLTVGNQISESLRRHQLLSSNDSAESVILDWLNKMGFENPDLIAKAYPNQLSGGMNQRIAIILSLLTKPDLLIADEPTTAVDPITEARIMKHLDNLQKQFGFSLFLISHNIALIKKMTDMIAVMYRGRILEMGPTKEITAEMIPKHPYTEKLLNAVPKMQKKKKHFPEKKAEKFSSEDVSDAYGCPYFADCEYAESGDSAMPCDREPPVPFYVNPDHYICCQKFGRR